MPTVRVVHGLLVCAAMIARVGVFDKTLAACSPHCGGIRSRPGGVKESVELVFVPIYLKVCATEVL